MIDVVQLHGLEEEKELNYLRSRIVQPVIKAFCIKKEEDVRQAERSPADFILLDSGAGTGRTFSWGGIKHMERPYFLAGGIHIDNVEKAALRAVKKKILRCDRTGRTVSESKQRDEKIK